MLGHYTGRRGRIGAIEAFGTASRCLNVSQEVIEPFGSGVPVGASSGKIPDAILRMVGNMMDMGDRRCEENAFAEGVVRLVIVVNGSVHSAGFDALNFDVTVVDHEVIVVGQEEGGIQGGVGVTGQARNNGNIVFGGQLGKEMFQEGGIFARNMDFDGISDQATVVQVNRDLAADEIEDWGTVAAFRSHIVLEFGTFGTFGKIISDGGEGVKKGGLQRMVVGELRMLAVKETDVDGIKVLPSRKVIRLHKGINSLEHWNQGFLYKPEGQVGMNFKSKHHRRMFPTTAEDSKGLIKENIVAGDGTGGDLGAVVREERDLEVDTRDGGENRAEVRLRRVLRVKIPPLRPARFFAELSPNYRLSSAQILAESMSTFRGTVGIYWEVICAVTYHP